MTNAERIVILLDLAERAHQWPQFHGLRDQALAEVRTLASKPLLNEQVDQPAAAASVAPASTLIPAMERKI